MLISISFIAAILTTISFLPQAIRVIRTKDTSSLSLVMYLMFTVGVSLWLIYGIGMKDAAITGANGVTLIFAVIILTFKIINVKNGKDTLV